MDSWNAAEGDVEGAEVFGLAEETVKAGLEEVELVQEGGLAGLMLAGRLATVRARRRCLRWRERAEADRPYWAAGQGAEGAGRP